MTTGPISLDQLTNPCLTGLVYGRPGCGKTIFACGSQVLRTCLFDIDKGTLSLSSNKTSELLIRCGYPPIRRDLIKVWPISTYQDFEAGLKWFETYRNYFDLAVIDTATELQRVVGHEIKVKNKSVILDQRGWGVALDTMEYVARTFRDMGKHCIFLGHETSTFDVNTGQNMYRPNFKGQFKDDYAKHFSLIARYVMVNQQGVDPATNAVVDTTLRFLNCNLDPTTDAKDRSSALDKFELPILDNILHKVLSATVPQGGTTTT